MAVANAQSIGAARPTSFGGWPLFWLNALGLTAMAVVLTAQHDFGIEGVRVMVRTTAQTSLCFFLIAFSASSLHGLAPFGLTRWLLANRRYFGVSFAYSHFLHAIGLYLFSTLDPVAWAEHATTVMFVFGGAAYVFIALMALTSFDRTAALLGPWLWQKLHTTGAYYIWFVFLISEGRRAVNDTYYWPFVGALFAAMALRLLAGRSKRSYLAR
jgi:methionine sulfoxide reductase heme-binding subunit